MTARVKISVNRELKVSLRGGELPTCSLGRDLRGVVLKTQPPQTTPPTHNKKNKHHPQPTTPTPNTHPPNTPPTPQPHPPKIPQFYGVPKAAKIAVSCPIGSRDNFAMPKLRLAVILPILIVFLELPGRELGRATVDAHQPRSTNIPRGAEKGARRGGGNK